MRSRVLVGAGLFAACVQGLRGQTEAPHLEVAEALIRAAAPERDDPDTTLTDLLAVATAHKRSATSVVLLREVQERLAFVSQPETVLNGLERYLEGSPHGLGQQVARHLEDLCRRALDPRFEVRHPDVASSVLVIGPFGDRGDFYTGVVFPPELDFPGPDVALAGRFGPVRTRVVERQPHRRAMPLVDPRTRERGCQYALHRVRAETAVSGYLELGCNGSFQMFLNGVEVARLNRNRAPGPETSWIPIALREGDNHVLVKTTSADRDRISLRYCDGAGRTLDSVREIPAGAERLGWSQAEPPPTPGPFVDGVGSLRDAAHLRGEELATLRVALALAAFRAGRIGDGLRALRDLEREPPDDPQSRLALAVAVQNATGIPQEVRGARVRQLIESVGDRLGTHHGLLMGQVGLLVDEDRREEALHLLQAEVDPGRAGPETFARLHEILMGLRFSAEARRLLDRWAASWPADSRAVLLLAASRSRGGDPRGALRLLRNAPPGLANRDAMNRRILEIAAELGEEEVALRALEALHGPERGSLAALRDRAVTWRRLGRSEREREVQRLIADHPDATADDSRRAGERLYLLGDRSAAVAAFGDSLKRDPSRRELRALLSRLGGAGEGFPALARFRRDGDAAVVGFESGDRESAASTLVVDQMIVQVFEDGSQVREVHQVRRINDLRGVERFKDVDLPPDSADVLRLRTIATDGKSYVPNRVQGRFSMPRMEPGAFVESIYREYGAAPGAGPWRGPLFLFQSQQEPYVLSELVMILPPEPRGSFRVRGFAGPPETIELDDGNTATVFRRTDMPRLQAERFSPPLAELAPAVAFGEDGDIRAAARTAYALALRRTWVTPFVTDKAREIAGGLEGDRARIEAVHRFVHQQIPDGGGSSDPTTILLRGQGVRFFLLAAMLDALDVPYRHALASAVRPELRANRSPFLGEERFDVPALLVEPRNGEPLWLFPDSPRYWPLGTIPARRSGAPVLMLHEGGGTLSRLPDEDRVSGLGYRLDAAIGLHENGSASVRADLLLRGPTGLQVAEQLRNIEETIREVAARRLITGILNGWTLQRVRTPELDRTGTPLRVSGELERQGALRPAGESWLMALPVLRGDYVAALGDRSGRRHPYQLTETTADSWEISVDPGTHYRFAEVPDPVQVQHDLLDYSLTYRMQGPVMAIRREIRQKPGRIPAARFDEWLHLLDKLDQAEAVNLRLVAK